MSFEDYIDHSGLLTNGSERDGGDTAQMTGLYRFGKALVVKKNSEQFKREQVKFAQELDMLTHIDWVTEKDGTVTKLIAHPGIYVRYPKPCDKAWWANPRCFSRDQQRSLVMAMGILKQKKKLFQIFWQHIKRFGFYQNNEEIDGTKITPDFASPEHWAEYLRAFFSAGIWPVALLYPLLLIGDLAGLVGFAFNMFQWKNPDDADDDNLIMHLLQARTLPTPVSWLHRKLYTRFRPIAGYTDDTKTITLRGITDMNGPMSAVAWKHRSSTGSPPFYEQYQFILKEKL